MVGGNNKDVDRFVLRPIKTSSDIIFYFSSKGSYQVSTFGWNILIFESLILSPRECLAPSCRFVDLDGLDKQTTLFIQLWLSTLANTGSECPNGEPGSGAALS